MQEENMRFKKVPVLVSLLAVLVLTVSAGAQECGPGCPACSGKATGDLLSPGTVFASGLFIPDGEEETAVLRLGYGLVSWMDVGIGYAVDAEEVTWSVRTQPITQDREGWRPAVIIGTGSVQTGGSDQSAYIQVAKTLEVVEGRLGVSTAVGYATDLPDLEEIGLSYFATEWLTITGYMLEMEELALSASVRWDLGE
jgi:hypothetical protein